MFTKASTSWPKAPVRRSSRFDNTRSLFYFRPSHIMKISNQAAGICLSLQNKLVMVPGPTDSIDYDIWSAAGKPQPTSTYFFPRATEKATRARGGCLSKYSRHCVFPVIVYHSGP